MRFHPGMVGTVLFLVACGHDPMTQGPRDKVEDPVPGRVIAGQVAAVSDSVAGQLGSLEGIQVELRRLSSDSGPASLELALPSVCPASEIVAVQSTDQQGRFEFDGVSGGVYDLVANARSSIGGVACRADLRMEQSANVLLELGPTNWVPSMARR